MVKVDLPGAYAVYVLNVRISEDGLEHAVLEDVAFNVVLYYLHLLLVHVDLRAGLEQLNQRGWRSPFRHLDYVPQQPVKNLVELLIRDVNLLLTGLYEYPFYNLVVQLLDLFLHLGLHNVVVLSLVFGTVDMDEYRVAHGIDYVNEALLAYVLGQRVHELRSLLGPLGIPLHVDAEMRIPLQYRA